MIVTLRVHYQASYSKVGGLARAIWGEHASQMVDGEWTKGALLGRALINRAEATLVFERASMRGFALTVMPARGICPRQTTNQKSAATVGRWASFFQFRTDNDQ